MQRAMVTALGLVGTPKASLSPMLTPVSWCSPSVTGLGYPTTRTPSALGSDTIQGQAQNDQGKTEEREPHAGSPEVGVGQNTTGFLWPCLLFRGNDKRSCTWENPFPCLSPCQRVRDRDTALEEGNHSGYNPWPRALTSTPSAMQTHIHHTVPNTRPSILLLQLVTQGYENPRATVVPLHRH